MDPDPKQATEIAPGVTLFTRDGSRIGNAIVVKEAETPEELRGCLKKTGQKLWLLETDFGNNLRYSDNEIHEVFKLGYVQSHLEWTMDRRELQREDPPE